MGQFLLFGWVVAELLNLGVASLKVQLIHCQYLVQLARNRKNNHRCRRSSMNICSQDRVRVEGKHIKHYRYIQGLDALDCISGAFVCLRKFVVSSIVKMHLGISWHPQFFRYGNGEGAGNEKRISECLRSDSFQNLWSCTQEIISTDVCKPNTVFSAILHIFSITPPPEKKKKNTLFLQQKVASISFKDHRPALFVGDDFPDDPGDSSRWPSTRWSMTIIGWLVGKNNGRREAAPLGRGRVVVVGGCWWLMILFLLLSVVVLFLLIYCFFKFDPWVTRNTQEHAMQAFFDQTCFVDSSENLKPLTQLEGFKQKKHLAIAIFEDMFQRIWDASMLPYPSLETQLPGLEGTFHCRWSWTCIWAIPKHSMNNAFI